MIANLYLQDLFVVGYTTQFNLHYLHDAATFRFGLMFCPDPIRAASEIRRVLRTGGRLAVVVWDVPTKNPFFTALLGVLSEFVPMPPPDPTAPESRNREIVAR